MRKNYPPADTVEIGYYEPSTQLVAREALARGLEVEWVNRAFLILVIEGCRLGIWSMRSDLNSAVAAKSVQRRDVCRSMLVRVGVPVATGRAFRSASAERGLKYAARLANPVLLRAATGPTTLWGVTIPPEDEAALREAWNRATAEGSKFVLVESPPLGRLLRFLVIGGRCVSVVERTEAEGTPREGPTDSAIEWRSVEVSGSVADHARLVAERAVAAIPGLSVAGIDLVVTDGAFGDDQYDHAVLNISAAPNLTWHQLPSEGSPVDCAGMLLDELHRYSTLRSMRPRSERVPFPSAASEVPVSEGRETPHGAKDSETLGHRFPRADTVEIGYYELSTHLLALEAMRRGHQVHWVHRSYFTLHCDGELLGFWCTRTDANSAVGAQAVLRKDATRRLLRAQGVGVAKGGSYGRESFEKARARARSVGYPVVVKPSDGKKGEGVTVGVRSDAEFERAWHVALAAGTRTVVVERMFRGHDARFLVVGDRCVAVTGRPPPQVVGDGRSTVAQLLERANEERRQNPHLASRPILLDPHRIDHLVAQGHTMESVPEANERVTIDDKAGMSAGGGSVDVLEKVHPSYRDVAVRATAAIPGLAVAGVDILASDYEQPAGAGNYIVVEINSMPGIGSHHFPGRGETRDAAGAILDYCGVRSLDHPSVTSHHTGLLDALALATRRVGRRALSRLRRP